MGGVRWSEQQYRDFMRKQPAPPEDKKGHSNNGKPLKLAPGVLTFVLPLELAPLRNGRNGLDRMHWAALNRLKKRLGDELRRQVPNASGIPFAFAKVEIVRQTAKEPDPDGLTGFVKPILDAMQVPRPNGKRTLHPYGAYIIQNDDSDHIELAVRWEQVPPRKGQVLILVTPRPDFGRK